MSLSDLSLPTDDPPPHQHVMAAAGLMGLKLFQAWTGVPAPPSHPLLGWGAGLSTWAVWGDSLRS